jgi:hypothetical protein
VGLVALTFSVAALGALAVAGIGKYLAIGLGIFAVGAGIVGYRQSQRAASRRLAGAAGIALGTVALALGGLQVALTIAVLERLQGLLSTVLGPGPP